MKGLKQSLGVLLAGQCVGFLLLTLFQFSHSSFSSSSSSPPLFYLSVVTTCVVSACFGGCKVLFAPTLHRYLHSENSNVSVGMCLVAISLAALVGPNLTGVLSQPLSSSTNDTVTDADADDDADAGIYTSDYSTFFPVMMVFPLMGLMALPYLTPMKNSKRSKTILQS
jgi:O-antigen/teichoic acid export membrane protein